MIYYFHVILCTIQCFTKITRSLGLHLINYLFFNRTMIMNNFKDFIILVKNYIWFKWNINSTILVICMRSVIDPFVVKSPWFIINFQEFNIMRSILAFMCSFINSGKILFGKSTGLGLTIIECSWPIEIWWIHAIDPRLDLRSRFKSIISKKLFNFLSLYRLLCIFRITATHDYLFIFLFVWSNK